MNVNNDSLKNYINDVCYLLKEAARESKLEKDASDGLSDSDFKQGYLMGLHYTISC